MRPVSVGEFANLYARLDSGDQQALVADLYEARGWEVTSGDEFLTLSRNGDTRRLAMVEPSRFGSVSLPEADTVVATRDDEGVRASAEQAGIEYLSPGDVRDLLLYGLDRETALDIFESYFDQPLLMEDSSPAVDDSRVSAGLFSSLDRNAGRVSLVIVVLLVAGVWVAGAGILPEADREPTAPQPNVTYTPGEAGAIGGNQTYPPGLGPEGLVNTGELALAHQRHVENRTTAYRIEASGPQHAPFMFGRSFWQATVYQENKFNYRYRKRSVAPYGFRVEQREDNRTVWDPKRPIDPDNETSAEVLTKWVYASGEEKFWRFEDSERVRYQRAGVGQENGRFLGFTDPVGWVDEYIVRYLWTDSSTVTCLTETETGDCRAYRAEATGDPVELRPEVFDYRAVAVVERSGFVRSLTVRYNISRLGNEAGQARVRFHMEYIDTEGITDTPSWLEDARNRTTDPEGTATPSPTETATQNSTETATQNSTESG
jgi:hypothetical protein